jgi:hypothetical protein
MAALAGVALAAATIPATAGKPEPFKLTNIHFETNASACDMGIQIGFDTDGITEGSVEDPNERVVWPAGTYEFDGQSGGVEFEGIAKLSHKIPAGPVITAPVDGAVVPHDAPLLIRWKKVTGPILPNLGPVEIVGYHVVVVDVTNPALPPGKLKTALDADLSKTETSFVVPKQYLEPNRIYEFEVLATDRGGNQTITEGGAFCTPPIVPAKCKLP